MTVELLSVEDVARITGLSAYTVRAAIRDDELAATKLRSRWRVHPDELAAWLDAGRVRPAGSLVQDASRPTPRPHAVPPAGGYREAVRARRKRAA